MRRYWLTLLLVLWTLPAWGGRLQLDPPVVPPGGVSWLVYHGEAELVVARFRGQPLRLPPAPGGARRLLGVDLELPPGHYPVEVLAGSAAGRSEQLAVELEVRALERPVERLQLPDEMVTPKSPEVLARIEREALQLQELFGQASPLRELAGFEAPVGDPTGSPFGLRRVLNGIPKSPHAGVDFRSPRGTEVHAPAPGRVVLADDLYYTGRTVILDHGGGLFSLYAHLDDIAVQAQAEVARGTVLGRVGSSGRSTGPHLHWGVRLLGARVDPLLVAVRLKGKSLD